MTNGPFYDESIGVKLTNLIEVMKKHGSIFASIHLNKFNLGTYLHNKQFTNNEEIMNLFNDLNEEAKNYLDTLLDEEE